MEVTRFTEISFESDAGIGERLIISTPYSTYRDIAITAVGGHDLTTNLDFTTKTAREIGKMLIDIADAQDRRVDRFNSENGTDY